MGRFLFSGEDAVVGDAGRFVEDMSEEEGQIENRDCQTDMRDRGLRNR